MNISQLNTPQLNTPQPSDIKILDNLLALNLNISLWSARKKLTQQDFWGAEFSNVELPPEDLATQPMNCTNLPEIEENAEAEDNTEAEDNFYVPSFSDDLKSRAVLKFPLPNPTINIPSLGLW